MNQTYLPAGMGWRRDLPDARDRTLDDPCVRELLAPLCPVEECPEEVDLREFCSNIGHQEGLNASPAYACVGLTEYFLRRALGEIREHSPLFLYKVTRRLMNETGDSGADLRTTLKALVRFGLPPFQHGPQSVAEFDREPTPFEYGFAESVASMIYVRLDGENVTGEETLESIKTSLTAGFPAVFGFPVPTSLSSEPDIPFRPAYDGFRGGVAAVAVGYDDRRISSTKGAVLIRSPWGEEWGDSGYGWLPYAYIRKQLAVDFWTFFKLDWLQSGEFQCPRRESTLAKNASPTVAQTGDTGHRRS